MSENLIPINPEDEIKEAQLFLKEAESILSELKNVQINSVNDLISLVYPLMQKCVVYTHLSGSKKKQVVIQAIKLLVSKSEIPDSLKSTILAAVDVVLSPVIDQIYSFTAKELSALEDKITGCFSKGCKCC